MAVPENASLGHPQKKIQASAFRGEVLGKDVTVERPVSATSADNSDDAGLDGSQGPAAKMADLTASVLAESFFIGQKVRLPSLLSRPPSKPVYTGKN